ncbi:MAG: histidinol-phosphate transaminase, partial [Candidatus Omnitrophica bacterium]|nr:histidinol-phosphate transaminase [Candidatus Omnitrophota bacterium]
MESVRDPFNVNSVAQVAAIAALKDKKFLAKTKRLTQAGRKFFYNSFKKLGVRYI